MYKKYLISALAGFLMAISGLVLATDRPLYERYNIPREACAREYGAAAEAVYWDRILGTTLEQSLLLNKDAPPVVHDLIKWVFSLNISGLSNHEVRRLAITRCLKGATI